MTRLNRDQITTGAGIAGSVIAGIGIGQVLHGHPWGYLLIAAGLAASAPYFMTIVRSLLQELHERRRAREGRH